MDVDGETNNDTDSSESSEGEQQQSKIPADGAKSKKNLSAGPRWSTTYKRISTISVEDAPFITLWPSALATRHFQLALSIHLAWLHNYDAYRIMRLGSLVGMRGTKSSTARPLLPPSIFPIRHTCPIVALRRRSYECREQDGDLRMRDGDTRIDITNAGGSSPTSFRVHPPWPQNVILKQPIHSSGEVVENQSSLVKAERGPESLQQSNKRPAKVERAQSASSKAGRGLESLCQSDKRPKQRLVFS
ncbi:hypothetical protein F5887DRAFT_925520 [Amanita rubescens]|nr:hypothetical protein F5887DRAFT_925520 [Amanita rubescens]